MTDQPPSAWTDAVRQQVEAELKCPKCASENTEGASPLIVVVGPSLVADCHVCSHSFVVRVIRQP